MEAGNTAFFIEFGFDKWENSKSIFSKKIFKTFSGEIKNIYFVLICKIAAEKDCNYITACCIPV